MTGTAARTRHAGRDLAQLQRIERDIGQQVKNLHPNATRRPVVEAKLIQAQDSVRLCKAARAAIDGELAIAEYERLIGLQQVHA